jgi:thiosulfate/3-mercaptopyruvate sulfurtransferase
MPSDEYQKLLVDPAELAALLGLTERVPSPQFLVPTRDVQIIDTRPAEDFADGRIPGALHLDLWAFSLNNTDPAPLESFLWMIAHVLAARGIDPSRPVVVYDETSGIRAARAFWFLEYFGHPDARLLDGGFAAWRRAGLPIETGGAGLKTGPSAKTGPAKTPSDWPERAATHRDRLATWKDVRDRIGASGAVILDTRTDEEHYGEVARAKRGGSVPGAVHIEWTRNLTGEGAFKPAADLRTMYEQAGVTPDRDVVTYCQGGYRAAHSYLALRLLGYPRVRTYIGSWKEWGDRDELPIEVPKRQP